MRFVFIFTSLFVLGCQTFSNKEMTSLMRALWNQNLVEVKSSLEDGEDPNQRNEYGVPAIILALGFNDPSIINLFINYGADVNISDANGFSPLIVASGYEQHEICELLIKNGADIDKKHNNGFTALMLAAQNGDLAMVRTLLKNGASIDIDRPRGGTALCFAADKGNLDVAKILLENNANINFADSVGGYTPLMIAVYMKRYEMVEYLLKMGSDKDIKTKDGQTVYDFARQVNDRRINELLEI
jgi:ankyrin repeat protein